MASKMAGPSAKKTDNALTVRQIEELVVLELLSAAASLRGNPSQRVERWVHEHREFVRPGEYTIHRSEHGLAVYVRQSLERLASEPRGELVRGRVGPSLDTPIAEAIRVLAERRRRGRPRRGARTGRAPDAVARVLVAMQLRSLSGLLRGREPLAVRKIIEREGRVFDRGVRTVLALPDGTTAPAARRGGKRSRSWLDAIEEVTGKHERLEAEWRWLLLAVSALARLL